MSLGFLAIWKIEGKKSDFRESFSNTHLRMFIVMEKKRFIQSESKSADISSYTVKVFREGLNHAIPLVA